MRAAIDYDRSANEGAILLCDPITKEWVEQGSSRIKNWGYSIAEQIFQNEKQTKDRGYFVVTGIHRTRRCLIHCWENRENSVSMSVRQETSITPLASAELEAHSKINTQNLGWIKCPDAKHSVIRFWTSSYPLESTRNGIYYSGRWVSILSCIIWLKIEGN